jgi:SnoaL-like domain
VLSKQDVRDVIAIYIEAWTTQNPDLIVTIFTEGATYHERVMQDPIPNREAIRGYWESKVVGAQANISCELVSLYLDGDTAIAEWEAEFDDVTQGVRKHMKEIAVLEFEGRQIASLREYWASESLGPDAATRLAEAIRVRDEREFDLVHLADRVSVSARRADSRGGDAVE